MKRREFVTLLGGAAALPLAARGQQPAMPVIGFLLGRPIRPPAFVQALRERGFVEGRTVEFDFRWGSNDDLPALAAELVRRRVAVIVTGGAQGGPPAARAAMVATATIPIVFQMGEDPVKEGVVPSINRPSGNVTGYTNFNNQLVAKRFDLLHELVPSATVLGFLANPTNQNVNPDTAEVQAAADALGLRLRIFTASTERELEAAFDGMMRERVGALLVGVDPWFRSQPERMVALAARHMLPANYERREYAMAGGLMSYGNDLTEQWRLMGTYTGRILKGEKPADLPVYQATKFEFILNLKTANLTVPLTLLVRADEVIE